MSEANRRQVQDARRSLNYDKDTIEDTIEGIFGPPAGAAIWCFRCLIHHHGGAARFFVSLTPVG